MILKQTKKCYGRGRNGDSRFRECPDIKELRGERRESLTETLIEAPGSVTVEGNTQGFQLLAKKSF